MDEDTPRSLGSQLVGYYSRGWLIYAGNVGTGFTLKDGRAIIAQLDRQVRRDSPFVEVPRECARDAHWVEPELVAEVEFTEWTREGRIRHPSFEGLREDKDAKSVVIEKPDTRAR